MSDKFLSKFFEKLTPIDLKHDKFLSAFYNCYLSSKEKDSELKLFQFYTEYLVRNKLIKDSLKEVEIKKIHDEIKNNICNTPIPTLTTANTPTTATLTTSTTTANVKTFKLNKKHALSVISDYIKQSFIRIYENPDEDNTIEDETFKNNATNTIIEELKNIGYIPTGKKDPVFNRRNDQLSIWQDTEKKCNAFLQISTMSNILKKVFFLDGCTSLNDKTIKTIEIRDTKEVIFPSEVINSRFTGMQFNTKISVLNKNPLSEMLLRINTTKPIALVVSGSRMIAGGGSDQGFETNETSLYYSSSYNLCLNQINYAYPLEKTQMLICPNVLVFKDHTDSKYSTLLASDSQRISVICNPTLYRPKTNLEDQNQYEFDNKLYLSETKYINAQPYIDKIKALFTNALLFGFTTIIIDDGGIEDFWLPVVHY